MASSSYSQPETGRIQFPITPLKYNLRFKANEYLSTPLVIDSIIVPFTAGPDTIWSLANFSALATGARGIVGETVCNMMKGRTRNVIGTMGTGDFSNMDFRKDFSNEVFSNVQNGLRQYGLKLYSVQIKAGTETDTAETKPDAVEAKTDTVETKTEAVETEPEIYGNTTVDSSGPELETDSDMVLVFRD